MSTCTTQFARKHHCYNYDTEIQQVLLVKNTPPPPLFRGNKTIIERKMSARSKVKTHDSLHAPVSTKLTIG